MSSRSLKTTDQTFIEILLNTYFWTGNVPLNFGSHRLLDYKDPKTEKLQLGRSVHTPCLRGLYGDLELHTADDVAVHPVINK